MDGLTRGELPTPWLSEWYWTQPAWSQSKPFGPVHSDPAGMAAFYIATGAFMPKVVIDLNKLRNNVLEVYGRKHHE